MRNIILILIVSLITFNTMSAPNLSSYDKELKELNKSNMRELDALFTADFSEINLRRLLELLDVEHVDIIINQARLESSWFTSRLFKKYNNLFGMHRSYIRESYSSWYVVADNNAHVAVYDTWVDCVKDFVLYLDYYRSIGYCTDDYYNFLKVSGYCEKDTYVNILKRMV